MKKLLDREPTEEMLEAGFAELVNDRSLLFNEDMFKKMLQAAFDAARHAGRALSAAEIHARDRQSFAR